MIIVLLFLNTADAPLYHSIIVVRIKYSVSGSLGVILVSAIIYSGVSLEYDIVDMLFLRFYSVFTYKAFKLQFYF